MIVNVTIMCNKIIKKLQEEITFIFNQLNILFKIKYMDFNLHFQKFLRYYCTLLLREVTYIVENICSEDRS